MIPILFIPIIIIGIIVVFSLVFGFGSSEMFKFSKNSIRNTSRLSRQTSIKRTDPEKNIGTSASPPAAENIGTGADSPATGGSHKPRRSRKIKKSTKK